MPWSAVVGHAESISRLKASVAGGRLGQAYAFVGPAGIGKKQVALAFTQALLCDQNGSNSFDGCGHCRQCVQVAAKAHPDLILIELESGKSAHPIAAFNGEGEDRRSGLCYEMSLHPLSAQRRVAIIDDAHTMAEDSANAILKTLEEPPPGAVMILIAPSLDLLLPTIRSRCQILPFQSLSSDELKTVLRKDPEVDPQIDLNPIAALSEGSLIAAKQLLNPQLSQSRSHLYQLLATTPFDLSQFLVLSKSMVDTTTTAKAGQRSQAGWVIRFSLEFFRQAMLAIARNRPAPPAFAEVGRYLSRFPDKPTLLLDRFNDVIERCLTADRQLDGYMGGMQCLEAWGDDVARLLNAPLN